MDDDGLNMRNWGYYEPSFKEHLGLQLMSLIGDQRDTKPFLLLRDPVMVNANGAYHPRNCVAEAPVPLNYMRDSWIQRERFIHMLPGNASFGQLLPESPANHHPIQIMQPMGSSLKDEDMSEEDMKPDMRKGGGSCPTKKRPGPVIPKAPRAKKPTKGSSPKENDNSSTPRSKPVKKSMDVVINGIDMNISGIPVHVCSCTGTPQQYYRWGCGGWQSACCTTTISAYPLPMSTKRRGSRITGWKMSQGAFKKVLEKLASEGYNFANAIDLKLHWAKHGTNKFVTIR